MKRLISLILASVMLISICPTAFAKDFTDLNSSHWAYSYVNELVADGTINGFEDGSFRPQATVTRAQFVKMIGNGPETRPNPFDDVDASHWAYGYIMTSGLDALTDNMFMPSTPITRNDVVNLLWKRAGSPMGITTPPTIHRQGNNYDAVSWAYTNGIMVGDDYVSLRLADTLTRAEATALIVRSRKISSSTEKVVFSKAIDEKSFEAAYSAFKLIDRPYDANATITNGELAMAVARLQCGMDDPSYPNVSAEKTFDHIYAQPINMLCRYYLGLENDNAAYADKNATVADTIAALMFVTLRSATAYIPSGTANYPGYVSAGNTQYDKYLSYAYSNGILTATGDELNFTKDVTMKELAALTIQFDGFSGFHKIIRITPDGANLYNAKFKANAAYYPKNSDNYRLMVSEVPNRIYEAPFAASVATSKDSYEVANTFKGIFGTMLSQWVSTLSKSGYELEVKYHPSMVVANGNGYTLRTLVKFKNVPQNTKLSTLINCPDAANANVTVKNGDSLYLDIDTGKHVDSINIGTEKMFLSKIIY